MLLLYRLSLGRVVVGLADSTGRRNDVRIWFAVLVSRGRRGVLVNGGWWLSCGYGRVWGLRRLNLRMWRNSTPHAPSYSCVTSAN